MVRQRRWTATASLSGSRKIVEAKNKKKYTNSANGIGESLPQFIYFLH